MHLLSREDRITLENEIRRNKPIFIKPYYPKWWWWWWGRCNVKVLVVTDSSLNFGIDDLGLSEFLTSFNELQATTFNNYQLTLGYRGGSTPESTNPLVVQHINDFNFHEKVMLNDFDQVWLFGFASFGELSDSEASAINNYMNNGGGLFATGDHGSIGYTLCNKITRVTNMRHWVETPEISMGGNRRNDTNMPSPGRPSSEQFSNQSDNIPQNITVRRFEDGMPHPLLSIKTSIKPNGVIDIMPDHTHEGECKPETSFTVNGITVATQIIATSNVTAGNIAASKQRTEAHIFPSIAVWDGHLANAGRIVVDSTWHHFVNINLNGTGSGREGLTDADFNVVRQYFMNISLWMSRKRTRLCSRRFLLIDLFRGSQLVEASLNNPSQKIENISLADLNSIGALAEEILSSKFNPGFAREFLIDALESVSPNLSSILNTWKPISIEKIDKQSEGYYQPWLNLDTILYTSIGAGFIAMRDDKKLSGDKLNEKDLDRVTEIFNNGMKYGYNKSIENLSTSLKKFSKESKIKL